MFTNFLHFLLLNPLDFVDDFLLFHVVEIEFALFLELPASSKHLLILLIIFGLILNRSFIQVQVLCLCQLDIVDLQRILISIRDLYLRFVSEPSLGFIRDRWRPGDVRAAFLENN